MQRHRKPPPTGGRGLKKKRFSEKKTFFLGSINKDLCEFGMDQRFFLELNAYNIDIAN